MRNQDVTLKAREEYGKDRGRTLRSVGRHQAHFRRELLLFLPRTFAFLAHPFGSLVQLEVDAGERKGLGVSAQRMHQDLAVPERQGAGGAARREPYYAPAAAVARGNCAVRVAAVAADCRRAKCTARPVQSPTNAFEDYESK